MDTMLWIIGYATGKKVNDNISGFVYSRRRTGSRVEIWTKDASLEVESLAKELSGITSGHEIEYRDHKGSLTYTHAGGKKKKKASHSQPQEVPSPAIPIPLPKPLPKVDVDAILQTMPESHERRGSKSYAEFEAFRKSLADDARAARRSIASMHVPEGRGEDYTPCPSPVKGGSPPPPEGADMPEVELPSPVIEDDYVLPEKKKKKKKKLAQLEGGSPVSGSSGPSSPELTVSEGLPSSLPLTRTLREALTSPGLSLCV